MNNLHLPKIENFKVEPNSTLFEPPWYVVKQGLCPLCGNKLQKMLRTKGYICRSPKHKAFVTKKYYDEIEATKQ